MPNKVEDVRICEIRQDKTQSRADYNADALGDYADKLRDRVALPPAIVFFDGTEYWCGDGFHRLSAASQVGWDAYPCEVREGGERDALKFSLGANQVHGIRRTNKDKEHAVRIALSDSEWGQWSNAALAELCGVSREMIAYTRDKIEAQPAKVAGCETRVGRDGKRRKVPVRPKSQMPKVAPCAEPSVDDPEFDPDNAPNAEPAAEFDPQTLEAQPTAKVDVPGLAAPYRTAVRSIGEIVKQFERLASEERTGAHLADKITRIKHDLTEASRAISQAEPVKVCEKCKGGGCRSCVHTGFWTRAMANSRK